MADDLKLLLTRDGGMADASALFQNAEWAGSYQQAARTLDFSIPVSSVDKGLPTVPCELGTRAQLYRSGTLLFDGYVFSRTRDTEGNTVDLSCADRGLYLNRNTVWYKFRNQTPEAMAKRVCADFGITVGTLAATGVSLSRNFPGVPLYKLIQTGYTLASRQTGERYLIRFQGMALEVVAKKQGESTLAIRPGSNLITLSVSESVEQMVNQVVIYDSSGNRLSTQSDQDAIDKYGLMQDILQKTDSADASAEAKSMLEDGQAEQKITVTVLGNPTLIAGNCVVLQEPVTQLWGLCWIDEDSHTWKNGLYQTKLTLNFRNLMDEQEAGRVPTA